MPRSFGKMLAFLTLTLMLLSYSVVFVQAATLDDLTGGGGSTEDTTQSDVGSGGDSDALVDYMRGYNPITSENMEQAQTYAGPVVNILGTISGALIAVASAAIFVVTALDLLYIGVPLLRPYMNSEYGAAQGGGAMGGMGMGMGMGGMGMRGMGGMGAMGGGAQGAAKKRCIVSDEAVYCVNLASASSQPQGGGAMGGMGMGGMGMGGMGAMGGGAQQEPMPMKSVIFEYLKKRMFFVILFFVCVVVLMSSKLTGCGINLGLLLLRILDKFNGQVVNVNI